MNKIIVPNKVSLLYLVGGMCSCLLFLLYVNDVWWMFFCCLLAYFIQLGLGGFLTDNFGHETKVNDKNELDKLDSQYKMLKIVGIILIILTVIFDTFPFWATFDWFCHGLGLYIPQYEGGLLVTVMTIIIIAFWIYMIYLVINELKSPSAQYYENIKIKENEIKALEKEKAKAKLRHENNVAKFGEGYLEICSQFIVNEKEKKVWLSQNAYTLNVYAFDEIIDAEIEDIVTQHTTRGDIVTKTKTGNMIGRAVVGGALTGGAGAIIGGATAKKVSTVMPSEMQSKHRYNLLVTTRNISNPLITINFYQNGSVAQKCLATLKAIIHNK
ncbi:MAG: hypothetical protein J1F05_01395 [Muribaculaceae bacterium]|nr:hypothetical protein [Muribaculaceae bacterium]